MHASPRVSMWTLICLLSLPLAHASIFGRIADRIGLNKRIEQATCAEDEIFEYVNQRWDRVKFCYEWNGSQNATSTTYFTPVTTTTNIRSTYTFTQGVESRVFLTSTVTPTSTVWSTVQQAKLKRAPKPTPGPLLRRLSQIDQVDALANAVIANETTVPSTGVQAAMASSIGSACSCLGKRWASPYTNVITETESYSTRIIPAYTETTINSYASVSTRTIFTSVSAVTVTSTTTVDVISFSNMAPLSSIVTSSVALTSTVPIPPPYGMNFTCPQDHMSEQVLAQNTETFHYRIYCGTEFQNDTAIWRSTLPSQKDCLGACSTYNELTGTVACKGNSFDGATCLLFGEADVDDLVNSTIADSAVIEEVRGGRINFTLRNRLIGSSEASSASSVLEVASMTVDDPPASITANATSYSSCAASTYSNSTDNLLWVTSTCSWGAKWWGSWNDAATTIYRTTRVVRSSGGIGGGDVSGDNSGGFGSGSSPVPGQAASTTTWASSTASPWVSSWESNSTEVWASTAVGGSAGASSGETSGGTGGGGPIPASPTSVWTSNLTSVWASTDVIATSGASSGASEGGNGTASPLPPAPSQSTWSNESTTVESSHIINLSSGASSSFTSGGTGGASPIPTSWSWNSSSIWASTDVASSAGATSGDSSGGTGSGFPIPTSWSNSTIIESTTTIISVISSESSWLSTGGTGGASPIPNATITSSPSIGEITPTGNITVIMNSTTTVEEDESTRSRSRSQAHRSGSATTWSFGNFTEPFPPPSSTEAGPLTTSAPSATMPSSYGNYSSESDNPWTRSRPLGYNRSGSQSSGTSDVPETSEAPSSGFPIPYSNSTYATSEASSTGTISYPSWNSSAPAPTAPPSTTEESFRSSWLGVLTSFPPESESTTEDVGTGSSGFPIPTSNGTFSWSRSRTDNPRRGSQTTTSAWMNSTAASPTFASSSECPTTTATITTTVISTVYATSCPVCSACPPEPSESWGYGKGGKPDGPPWGRSKSDHVNPFPNATPGMSIIPSQSQSPIPSPSSSFVPPAFFQRPAGRTSPQWEVNTACRGVGNMIHNGEFELYTTYGNESTPTGWNGVGLTNSIKFLTANSSNQHTLGGRALGRVVTSSNEANATLVQSLTLCPQTTYKFTAWSRQLRPLAQCEASFSLSANGQVEKIGVISPTTQWSSGLAQAKTYTAPAAEVDFIVDVQCYGSSISATQLGTIEFDDFSLERVFS